MKRTGLIVCGTIFLTPVLLSAASPLLKGFYWMSGTGRMLSAPDSRFDSFLQNFDRNLKENQYLSGVYLNARWQDINPEDGVYKFERLDKLISLIKKHTKYYHLTIYPGYSSPAFIYKKGCVQFKAVDPNRYRSTYGKELTIPLPWDPVYKKYYYQMLAKLAEKYGNDPNLIAVTVVPYSFKSSELHLPASRRDIQNWEKYPGYKQKLVDEAKSAIDKFAVLFPKQQLTFELGMLVGAQRSEPEIADIIEYGYTKHPTRFTIQSDQLNGKFDNSQMFTYKLIMKYKDRGHNGFQSLSAWRHANTAKRQGSMELAVLNYIKTGAEFWQLWYGDGDSAEVCAKLDKILKQAETMGYEAYLNKLKKENKYKAFVPSYKR
jgi:hypothetical protein